MAMKRRAARALAMAAALVLGALPLRAETAVPVPHDAPAKQAGCVGRDLLAELPPDRRRAIDDAVAATPHAHGIRWTATKGDARIEIVGTYHFQDPRHETMIAAMAPEIAHAGALLVEAGPDEERALRERLARDPSLMVDPSGPTLPERLGEKEWAELSAAMAERGMPAIMVSRMRPWYVSLMLGISPCMMGQIRAAGDTGGLDHRLIGLAQAGGTPVRALEPWDTALALFEGLTPQEELDMIRAAMPAARLADDYAATTLGAYFRGDIWAIWEYLRMDAYDHSGLDRSAVDRQVELAEERLMARRNAGWITPLNEAATAAAAQGKPVVAAFGALHLPGERGVLRLLEKDGWTIWARGDGR